jgi:hypothetical protein
MVLPWDLTFIVLCIKSVNIVHQTCPSIISGPQVVVGNA